jgi:CelD/BcsL family acetyltransferase involved in cellulose biosynthesis
MLQRAARREDVPRGDAQSIRVRCIRSFDEVAALRPAWSALLQRAGTFTPFQTFEWHAAWWRVFGDDFAPFVLCVEEAGRLIGLAPLMLSERRLLGRRQRIALFIGLYQSDYCDFILDEGHPEALGLMLGWLADHLETWDALDLRNLEGGSASLQTVLEFFAARGHRVEQRVWNQAPTWMFGDAAADRNLLKKKSLRRHCNHFCRQGRLEFEHHAAEEDIVDHLEGFYRQHVERWGMTETPSQFLQERPRAFCREVVRALAPTGYLRFAVVSLDGQAIAYHLGFECNGRFIWYKPTFDVALARHSPGEVLIKYLLEEAAGRGLLEFDFGPGEEAFKYRFSNYARSICSAHVHRHRLAGWLDGCKFKLRTRIKGSPALKRLGWRLLRRWYGRLWY